MQPGSLVQVINEKSEFHNQKGVVVRHSLMSDRWVVVFPSGAEAPFRETHLKRLPDEKEINPNFKVIVTSNHCQVKVAWLEAETLEQAKEDFLKGYPQYSSSEYLVFVEPYIDPDCVIED